MREQLIQYVTLLFAGAQNCEDIKQEILQNTLDRYDDLIAEGKAPEAAYRLAITGIGDINEILGRSAQIQQPIVPAVPEPDSGEEKERKKKRAFAIGFYIASPIPLFMLSEFGLDTMGLCFTLLLVAAATILMIQNSPRKTDMQPRETKALTPQQELRKSVRSLISAVGIALYWILSFITGAWHVTWIMFPIIGAVQKLVQAILDFVEVNENEA
jgi:hypothetical protein